MIAADAYETPPVDADAKVLLDPSTSSKAGRRTKLAVSWETKAIARDLGPYLLGLTYTDNLTGAGDDLSIDVEDRDGLWSGDWRPTFGDKAVARIETTEGWFGENPTTSVRLGTFAHDKITLKGPPLIATLKCISAALSSGLRRRKRTHAWRGVTLKQIAQDIADRASLQLEFDGDPGGAFKSAVQNDKSDWEFLEELTKEVGRTLKITEGKIAIYDELKLDSTASSGEIDLQGGNVLGWDFEADESARYGSCHVSCLNPRTGKVVKYQYPPDGQTVDGLDPNGQTLEMRISVSDAAEAQVRAQKMLRVANQFAGSGKLSVVGDPGLVAGVTFDLKNAFSLDGKFIITKAEHRVGDGYECHLDVRRCIEAY